MQLVVGEVVGHETYGPNYHALTIRAPEIGGSVGPGQFVNVRCGSERSSILRRPFSVSRLVSGGPDFEIVFDVTGPGTRFLAGCRPGDDLDLIGPSGKGFTLPATTPSSCLMVGGGIGAAPLFILGDKLRADGHRVDTILGARRADLLMEPDAAADLSETLTLTTDDGSAGHHGRVTDVLAAMVETAGTDIVYACGPHPMLEAVARTCSEIGVAVEVAVEELMACGYGVCMTCVMPVRAEDGDVAYLRSCTEGPIFDGSSIAWNGSIEPRAAADRELAPAGTGSTAPRFRSAINEHPPPGN
jgi:dihydroorotate dehydrogenase electron transfer subunit